MKIQKMLVYNDVEICSNIMWHNKNRPIVIICPGINLSKSGPFFLLSSIAKGCYESGLNAVQFDYLGEGDSSGSFQDIAYAGLIYSIECVKRYLDEIGGTQYIYIGYGIGNILASEFYKRKDTKGLCLISPYFEAYKKAHEIVEIAKSNKEEYIFEENYIWPVINNKDEEQFWCSLIGIVPWLYYTPININLLYELNSVDFINNLHSGKADILILSCDDISVAELKNKEGSIEVIRIKDLYYRTKEEWELFTKWPKLWATIKQTIAKWAIKYGYTNEQTQLTDLLSDAQQSEEQVIALKQETSRYSISFNSNGKLLFGILDLPAEALANRNSKIPCVIYEPGLGGSRVDMSRIGPWMGKRLSQEGVAVLRYDSMGSGVSEGEFYEMTWDSRLSDLKNAINELERIPIIDVDNIAIISYSAGSKLACLAANRLSKLKCCVLWSPYLIEPKQGNNRVKFEIIEKNRLVSPLTGLWLGFEYFNNARSYNFSNEFENSTLPMLVIVGDDVQEDENISYINEVYKNCVNKKVLHYPGAHCFLYKYMSSILENTIIYITHLFFLKET